MTTEFHTNLTIMRLSIQEEQQEDPVIKIPDGKITNIKLHLLVFYVCVMH